ncbi:MAG: hypothetical protein ACRYFX_25320 [Janthinobacterium lividum]
MTTACRLLPALSPALLAPTTGRAATGQAAQLAEAALTHPHHHR